jgi:hypothetical protein
VTRGRLVGVTVGAFAALVLTTAVIPPARGGLPRILVIGLAAYGCLLARLGLGAGERPEAVPPPAPVYGELSSADEQDVRLARLDASLRRGTESPEHWARTTRPLLRRLATERLRTRAGIDVTADPAGARRLMGEELWEIFATRPEDAGPAPAPERLALLVGRLERL